VSTLNLAALPVFKDALGNPITEGDLVAVGMMWGRSSAKQEIGWIVKLPKDERGKLTIKLLKRGSRGQIQHRQPFYNSNKILRITDLAYQWHPGKYADRDDF
jgi:hypothetical protein